jgi:hypothetical protein
MVPAAELEALRKLVEEQVRATSELQSRLADLGR